MNILPTEQSWKVTVDLLSNLKSKGYNIPNELNQDLSMVRSQIGFYKRDPSSPELMEQLMKAEMTLTQVQEQLINLAKNEGEEYVENWENIFKKASQGEKVTNMPKLGSRFIVNAPPGLSSARIILDKPISEERVQEVAEYENVILEFDDDVTIAVYGEREKVQKALKELGPFFSE